MEPNEIEWVETAEGYTSPMIPMPSPYQDFRKELMQLLDKYNIPL